MCVVLTDGVGHLLDLILLIQPDAIEDLDFLFFISDRELLAFCGI